MVTSKERIVETNGLCTFVKGLIGTKVYAELRAGAFVIGILQDCDQYLNLRIRNAVFLRARKEERVDEFFISGRHLRYIHLDHYVDVSEAIHRSFSKSRKQSHRQPAIVRTVDVRKSRRDLES
ncbi:Sm domain-containing protein [Trichostrongylus colubriformis]|uniref:Sm domain-containing protein n=1 Tax=Trichostrongylus colubriformis TaxID=6319 RepID=A0AAN8G443_TRICO